MDIPLPKLSDKKDMDVVMEEEPTAKIG